MYLPVGICWYLQGRFIFLGQAPASSPLAWIKSGPAATSPVENRYAYNGHAMRRFVTQRGEKLNGE